MTHTALHTTKYPGFTINEYWFGYQSYKEDGEPLVRSHTLGDCKYWSEQVLKAEQDGGWSSESSVLNDGVVGGKL